MNNKCIITLISLVVWLSTTLILSNMLPNNFINTNIVPYDLKDHTDNKQYRIYNLHELHR